MLGGGQRICGDGWRPGSAGLMGGEQDGGEERAHQVCEVQDEGRGRTENN